MANATTGAERRQMLVSDDGFILAQLPPTHAKATGEGGPSGLAVVPLAGQHLVEVTLAPHLTRLPPNELARRIRIDRANGNAIIDLPAR